MKHMITREDLAEELIGHQIGRGFYSLDIGSFEALEIAALVLELIKPATVTTLAELEALPKWAVVRLPSGQPAHHSGVNEWRLFGSDMRYKPSERHWLPATVIWSE